MEKFSDLESLTASSCTRAVVSFLVFTPKLTELTLNDVELTEADFETLSSALPRVRVLSLRGCRALNDATYYSLPL